MLSYQHSYHAGNLADVHKHYLMASAFEYLTRKDKPLTYIETHAGRGLYDVSNEEALKTGEAAAGIERILTSLDKGHPYPKMLAKLRQEHGSQAYPGSPLLAALLLRTSDRIQLAELHPQECAALKIAMKPYSAKCYQRDGFEMAHAVCPPEPRRGLMLIDPSWEIKTDYEQIPRHIAKVVKAWNVGIVALWYPILKTAAHLKMIVTLKQLHHSILCSEVSFPPVRKDHGMIGSGMIFINPPFGLDKSAEEIGQYFERWFP